MTEQITKTPSTRPTTANPHRQFGGPKSDALRKLLSRRQGATIAQVQKQLGWQPHTVRAAICRLRSSGVSIELDRSGKVARYRAEPGSDQ